MVIRSTKSNKPRESASDRVFNVIVISLLTLSCVVILVPLLHILAGSFSDPMALLRGEVGLLPVDFTLEMYEKVFKNEELWIGFRNTVLYTVLGTVISVSLTALAAYPLSRSDFYGKNVFMILFSFTMFFSGGMIPTYLVVKDLGLLNTPWAMVLPSAVSTYNLIIMRTFFQSTIPTELTDAASIDGCSDLGIFFRIVLPLSAPIIAVMMLFYGVALWNSWFPALLYLGERSMYPLQMILRDILIESDMSNISGSASDMEIIGDGLKYATMVISTLPIICLYPFLQKYFVKGVMIGAVKG